MNKIKYLAFLIPLLLTASYLGLHGLSFVYSDSADYLVEAHRLWSQGSNIFSEAFVHRYWKPTFFPLWTSIFFFSSKGSFFWGTLISLSLSLCLFIFSLNSILKKFINSKEALFLTILITLQAPFLSNGLHLMSEGWALSFWTLSLFFYLSSFKKGKILAAFSLGLGAMISPVLTTLYFLPFYLILFYQQTKKINCASLYFIWPLLPIILYIIFFFHHSSPHWVWSLAAIFCFFLPLCFKNCPKTNYLFLIISLIFPWSWYSLHLSMLWDWVYLSSFSPYAQATGKFSIQRFKEYQGYLEFLPLGLCALWITLLGVLLKDHLKKKKELFSLVLIIIVPLILAFLLSANGDLRYFKWPFFLLLSGSLVLFWEQLSHLKKYICLGLLLIGALLSSLYLFQNNNERFITIKQIHEQLINVLPPESRIGVIPLGTKDNDLLQSRAIFQFFSFEKGLKHNFNFLYERARSEWEKKNFFLIGPCEDKDQIDPSLPISSKEFSKYCPDFSQERKELHFILKENSESKELTILTVPNSPLL